MKENIEVFTSTELTYMNNVIEYISWFITRKLLRTVSCHICLNVLTNTGHNVLNNTLLNIKSRGGLIKPSENIVLICKTAELVFRSHQQSLSSLKSNIIQYLTIKASSKLQINKLFNQISDHILDQSPLNNHLLQIIKIALKTFYTIRRHHFNNSISEPRERIRSHLTKTIHFRNQ